MIVNKINPKPMPEIAPLSKKELKILTSLSMGFLYKEIAADYNISINTVKKHIKNIYRKLEVGKRNEAVEKFFGHQEETVMPSDN